MPRKQKTIHYLYKTTCLITGRYYVGMHSTSNLEDGYMGSGKRLRHSIRKYGVENHKKEIIAFFDTRELLIQAEENTITQEMVIDDNCMNLRSGGTGGMKWLSKEVISKISAAGRKAFLDKLNSNIEYRIKYSNIGRINILKVTPQKYRKKKSFEGKTHSSETKEKMSQKASLRTGNQNSQYGTCWIMKEGVNKKVKIEEVSKWLVHGWIKGRKLVQ